MLNCCALESIEPVRFVNAIIIKTSNTFKHHCAEIFINLVNAGDIKRLLTQ